MRSELPGVQTMAQIDKDTIKYLTQLSRIGCTESEQAALLQDLQAILDYVYQMQTVNTEGVEPCSHAIPEVSNVMRDDVVGETLNRADFLANAPSQAGGMIRVPTIIKQP